MNQEALLLNLANTPTWLKAKSEDLMEDLFISIAEATESSPVPSRQW